MKAPSLQPKVTDRCALFVKISISFWPPVKMGPCAISTTAHSSNKPLFEGMVPSHGNCGHNASVSGNYFSSQVFFIIICGPPLSLSFFIPGIHWAWFPRLISSSCVSESPKKAENGRQVWGKGYTSVQMKYMPPKNLQFRINYSKKYRAFTSF